MENNVLIDYINNTNTKIIPNNKNIDNTINNNNYITNKNKNIDKDESKIKEKQQNNDTIEKSKLDYIDNKNNEINNNNLNDISTKSQIKDNEFNNYSYNCLTNNLDFIISKGTKQFIFTMELENNGKDTWPENKTTLSTDISISTITMKDIILEPLKPGLKTSINVIFNDIDMFQPGKYYSYLIFQVDGKKYGNKILVNIEVATKNDIKVKYNDVIVAFRDDTDIPKNIASDTQIGIKLLHHKTFEGTCNTILESLGE